MTGSPPLIGDSVRVNADAVRGCPHPVHATDARGCLEPGEDGTPRLGAVYDMIAANGSHNWLVALDCSHQHVVALTQDEMTR